MSKDLLRYDKLVEAALRGVVREALIIAARKGLPGNHHFYITFHTKAPGALVPDYLLARYPEEMTIVLEHQFWDLEVGEQSFSVTLSFQNRPERLTVPFLAVTAFADPSVKFGLQFQESAGGGPQVAGAAPGETEAKAAEPAAREDKQAGKPGEVVTLDSFRKK